MFENPNQTQENKTEREPLEIEYVTNVKEISELCGWQADSLQYAINDTKTYIADVTFNRPICIDDRQSKTWRLLILTANKHSEYFGESEGGNNYQLTDVTIVNLDASNGHFELLKLPIDDNQNYTDLAEEIYKIISEMVDYETGNLAYRVNKSYI